MTFKELKKKFESVKVDGEDGITTFSKCEIKVLEYLPIVSKCDDGLYKELDKLVSIVDGYMIINKFNYELYTMNLLAKIYCNIDFNGGISSDDYDFLYKNKFNLWLKEVTHRDSSLFIYEYFNRRLDDKINQHNSIASSLIRTNEQGLFDIKNLGENLENLKNIDPENLKVFEQIAQNLNKSGVKK